MLKFLASADSSAAELRIYEQIGADWFSEGVTAQGLAADLDRMGEVKDINVRINSPGGSVFDGIAIYNLLKDHPATVTVHVDGIAASIASVIAMAASPGRLFMADNAMLMIHDPYTMAGGNAEQLRAQADVLDKIKDAIATSYVDRTGLDAATVSELMSAETWMTAAEARAQGFADAVTKPIDTAKDRFDLSAFKNSAKAFPPSANPTNTQEHSTMSDPNKSVTQADIDNAAKQGALSAQAAERTRRTEIRTLFGVHAEAHRDILDQCLDDVAVSVADASKKLLDAIGKAVTPAKPNGHVEITKDARDKFVAGASNALLARAGVEKLDASNEWNGAGLGTLIRASLRLAGVAGVDRLERAALAARFFASGSMSTSDFPLVLANTANKALRKAYDAQPSTWRQWCDVGTVSDFKQNKRLQIGTFNSLATIPEGGEYTYGAFGEEGENIQAATKGKGLALTRQMIVNDDLSVFVKRASLMGFAAARTVNEDVYAYLIANGNTSDGGALFNATAETSAGGHANYTSSGTAISNASIGVGEKMMAVHKDKDGRTTLNISPKTLLVPRALKQTAWELLNAGGGTDVSQSNPNKRAYAASLGLDLVTDAALDASSSQTWYMIADPNICPLIEVAFLDGVQTPFTDEAVDWDTDALKLKVRLDYAVGAVDWRAGYKNAGA